MPTEEIEELLEQAITVGSPFTVAAAFAGIAPITLNLWLRLGLMAEGQDLPSQEVRNCHRLLKRLLRAEATFLVRALEKFARGDAGWQASAWAVERRFREHFSLAHEERDAAGDLDAIKEAHQLLKKRGGLKYLSGISETVEQESARAAGAKILDMARGR
ncbi:MAG: hypothetical protein WCV82_03760 [Candidatus Paceibacterota bacterium]|jgi:methionyl-tRNA formyltransferase